MASARGCRSAGAWVALILALGPGPTARAEGPERALEYEVKAAMLLNFAKFTDWPADSAQALQPYVTLCVHGRDPFGALLDETVKGRTVGGRTLVIKRYGSADPLPACNVVFFAYSERQSWRGNSSDSPPSRS